MATSVAEKVKTAPQKQVQQAKADDNIKISIRVPGESKKYNVKLGVGTAMSALRL